MSKQAVTLTFDTSKFFNSHLKQPKGYGFWFFKVMGESEPRSFQGSFTDCKQLLKSTLRQEGKGGHFIVDVLS